MTVSKSLRFQVLRRDNHAAQEEWRPIPSSGGYYEASSLGKVRSVDRLVGRTDGRTRNLRGKILRQQVDSQTGYPKVCLYRDGRRTHRYVHALVAEAFFGPCPEGQEVAHGSGVKTDVSVSNLRYATYAENQADKILHGTSNRGVRNPDAVLDEAGVWTIVERLNDGVFQRIIAEEFGIARTTVSAIATGRAWGHLTGRGAAA